MIIFSIITSTKAGASTVLVLVLLLALSLLMEVVVVGDLGANLGLLLFIIIIIIIIDLLCIAIFLTISSLKQLSALRVMIGYMCLCDVMMAFAMIIDTNMRLPRLR